MFFPLYNFRFQFEGQGRWALIFTQLRRGGCREYLHF